MNNLIHLLIWIIAETSNKPDDSKYHEHSITEPFRSRIDAHFGALIKTISMKEKERFLLEKIETSSQ